MKVLSMINRISRAILLTFLLVTFISSPYQVSAQEDEINPIQLITSRYEAGYSQFFLLRNLEKGDTLYVYMEAISGNLDPFVGLSDTETDPIESMNSFLEEIEALVDHGIDPLAVLPEIGSKYLLAWDDDSGEGYDAAMEFSIPKEGNYRLWVGDSVIENTSGDYRLRIGINTPEVLIGEGKPTGDTIAWLDTEFTRERFGIEEYRAALSSERSSMKIWLNELQKGDELVVFIEALSGDLKPTIILRDFGNKPLRSGNLNGKADHAILSMPIEETAVNYSLDISGCCEDSATTGDYRLLVGINAPEVLSGLGESLGIQIINEPKEVKVGIRLQQITDVDQIAENYSVVATLRMEWFDPRLAFNPYDCNCSFQVFPGKAFDNFIEMTKDEWPEFTIYNQQGNRWTQNRYATLTSDGRVVYLERFSTTLQAPDFDFTEYPFDTQEFYIHIDSAYPEEFYYYTNLESYTDLGDTLGEEQWKATDFSTEISSVTASTQLPASRYSYGITAIRHINYYVFRIFIPLLLIILVAWITFFLQDYGKRIDVTTGNLLLFIAFNFTVSADLPRLGYLTLLDAALVATFIISVLVVLYNVVFRRLEVSGRDELARKVDKYMIWVYPLAYLIAGVVIIQIYYL